MSYIEQIKTRRSVRTFDGKKISQEDFQKLSAFIENTPNPYDIPVRYVLLDAKEHNLSSPVLKGDTLYVAAMIEQVPNCEVAYGYSFEQLVLYAESLGIGTTWIGGTMNREHFESCAGVQAGEVMCCVSPLGYPAAKMSLKESAMRKGVKANWRKNANEEFFENDFSSALDLTKLDPQLQTAFEMVRLAPSAVNKQPWLIVKSGNAYHFYMKHASGFTTKAGWDMQKIDMGIALFHFMDTAGGSLQIADPGIAHPADVEYISTVIL